MIYGQQLLAQFLGVPPELVSERATARFEDWLHAHDVQTRQDELHRAIEAGPEAGRFQRRWTRQQVADWLEQRRAFIFERESRKPCPPPD